MLDLLKYEVFNAVNLFCAAIEESDNFEIAGTEVKDGAEVFVLCDLSKKEGIEGRYIEVPVSEVVKKVSNIETAEQIMAVLRQDRNPVVLHGITRIVGYYSRTSNWNKSKVGELRDRANGNYGMAGLPPVFQEDRMSLINSL